MNNRFLLEPVIHHLETCKYRSILAVVVPRVACQELGVVTLSARPSSTLSGRATPSLPSCATSAFSS